LIGTAFIWVVLACGTSVETARVTPVPAELQDHCTENIGEKRVEQVADQVYVAIGYDLGNTVVITTPEGNVVIDAMSRPDRAAEARADLPQGKTLALIYTHSHADHIGGASAWIDEGTEVWATEAFTPHFVKQYGVFREIEQRRASRQHGAHLSPEDLPCTSIGPRLDFTENAIGTGIRMPTHTFSGAQTLRFGGVEVELVAAPGETEDQLFVWLPEAGALMPGDNFYRAFPNLYTIRGTRRRPVDDWVNSLDAMRAREPAHLVPSHTRPIAGKEEVQSALVDYRDAIAWVRDAVVRGANEGLGPEDIDVTLPKHLAESPYLSELYGELEWSAKGIYTSELGWFEGGGGQLNPPPDVVAREIELMGGREAVLAEAQSTDDPQWALYLYEKLEMSAPDALRQRAEAVANTNERAYLLELAWEVDNGVPETVIPELDDVFLNSLPLEVFFEGMSVRVRPEVSGDVHETLLFDFGDTRWYVTQRRGVAQVVEGQMLPGTPEPFATLHTDPLTWKRIVLRQETTQDAIGDDRLTIDGNPLAVKTFTDRFRR